MDDCFDDRRILAAGHISLLQMSRIARHERYINAIYM
jgi:hypothetical protein